jgi:4-hydroxy-4-methyl-2-oxoglutarate aldolase
VTDYATLARLGAATVHEAAGRTGVLQAPFTQVVPGSRAAGPARTARCGQGDNLMVHALVADTRPGDVLVLTMPAPAPVALVGELIATQAQYRGAAAILVDGAVRDVEELAEIGLPIWARFVSPQGGTKDVVGELDVPVVVGEVEVSPGDAVLLDSDGIVVVPAGRVDEVLPLALQREARELESRQKYEAGASSYDLNDLRRMVEGG